MKNKIYLLVLAGLLSACGYQAVYKNSAKVFQNVAVGRIAMQDAAKLPGERRVAQLVNQRLEEVFVAGSDATYKLDLEIDEDETTLAVLEDATEKRFELVLDGYLTVTKHTGEVVFKRVKLTAKAPYNVENSPYSTDAGKQNAREDAALALAEEAVQYLNFYLYTKEVKDAVEN